MKMKLFKNISMFFMYFIYEIIIALTMNILSINFSKWSNSSINIFMLLTDLVYLVFVIVIYRKELKEDLKDFKDNGFKYIIKYIPIYAFGILLMAISNMLVYKITNIPISENEELVRNYIKMFPIYMTFSTVIYSPIVEEITFRKTFRNIIDNKYFYILLSGIIFGIIHTTGDITNKNEILLAIPYIIMGIDLSYIYYKSNNIFTTIFIHSIHNFVLLMVQFIGG